MKHVIISFFIAIKKLNSKSYLVEVLVISIFVPVSSSGGTIFPVSSIGTPSESVLSDNNLLIAISLSNAFPTSFV